MQQSKTFLVAGGSSAIAKATIQNLEKNGHRVISISRSFSDSSADQFPIEEYGFGKFPKLDVPLNGLVYFPGTINLKPFGKLTEADFKNEFSIHVLGAAAFIQAYLPQLDKNMPSSIVLLSSVAASVGMPYHASVSMAKGAVEGLVRSLAAELAPSVRVNAVAPSLVRTPMSERFINSPEKQEALEKKNPMRKIGTPEEIAQAIKFLLSEDSSWITGQVLGVDGGMNYLKV